MSNNMYLLIINTSVGLYKTSQWKMREAYIEFSYSQETHQLIKWTLQIHNETVREGKIRK